ncbi:MAG: hypothetical protein COB02_12925 [Candidatus Cloacimonadota bacterium]|nr:MAG: hypothetical protein COB02_12925 [Candidatus Cloacimonadota bacterium]
MFYIYIFFISLFSSIVSANPWFSGKDKGSYALSYIKSDYDRIYRIDKQIHLNTSINESVTNESFLLETDFGLNSRDTFIFTTIYSNIGSFTNGAPRDLFGPAYSGISESYFGLRRNYRNREIAMSMELGLYLSGDYKADAITAPSFGSDALALTWHWGLLLSPDSQFTTSIQYRYYMDNSVSDKYFINSSYVKEFKKDWLYNIFGMFTNSMGGVNLGDVNSGWTKWSFHKLDEMRLQFGLGLTHNLNEDWAISCNMSHLFDGRNTDASDQTLSITISKVF